MEDSCYFFLDMIAIERYTRRDNLVIRSVRSRILVDNCESIFRNRGVFINLTAYQNTNFHLGDPKVGSRGVYTVFDAALNCYSLEG